jgi:hypothetical protein
MPTNTYVALDKITLGTAATTLTFSSIPSTYTDLVIVANYGTTAAGNSIFLRLNGDTGSNYSGTFLLGSGSTASSYVGGPNESSIRVFGSPIASGTPSTLIATGLINIQNYSNSTTNKTVTTRAGQGTGETLAGVGLWRSTAAVTSVTLYMAASSILAGSTFSLYGIAAEGAAKATGGYITSDANYYYHTFTSSGTFTPLSTLSCDIMVVAGGGSGGSDIGGGGGAGGLLGFTSQSLSTAQTVTVGGGGAGTAFPSNGTQGGNSQFGSLTASVGGGFGSTSGTAGTGGSGGGARSISTAGLGTSGQGFAGNNGGSATAGGGGGSAQIGFAGAFSGQSGAGGNGVTTYSSWGLATSTGQNVSGTVYYAGGGGGGGFTGTSTAPGAGGLGGGGAGNNTNPSAAATANTGGGSGGAPGTSGNGGSGIVIVRYPKA